MSINKNIYEKKLNLVFEESAIDYIAHLGYDQKNGARPLRRVLQKEVEDHLAISILKGNINSPTRFRISCSSKCTSKETAKNSKLIFKQEKWPEYEKIKIENEAKLKKRQIELDLQTLKPSTNESKKTHSNDQLPKYTKSRK